MHGLYIFLGLVSLGIVCRQHIHTYSPLCQELLDQEREMRSQSQSEGFLYPLWRGLFYSGQVRRWPTEAVRRTGAFDPKRTWRTSAMEKDAFGSNRRTRQ